MYKKTDSARKITKSKLNRLNFETPIASRYFGGSSSLLEMKEKMKGKAAKEIIMTTKRRKNSDSNLFLLMSGWINSTGRRRIEEK